MHLLQRLVWDIQNTEDVMNYWASEELEFKRYVKHVFLYIFFNLDFDLSYFIFFYIQAVHYLLWRITVLFYIYVFLKQQITLIQGSHNPWKCLKVDFFLRAKYPKKFWEGVLFSLIGTFFFLILILKIKLRNWMKKKRTIFYPQNYLLSHDSVFVL